MLRRGDPALPCRNRRRCRPARRSPPSCCRPIRPPSAWCWSAPIAASPNGARRSASSCPSRSNAPAGTARSPAPAHPRSHCPGLRGFVERPFHIRYRGYDLEGKPVARTAKGFHARVVQHE
ncbi:MAG: peptide deformylase, partial [Alphaproteobacteria bacterium]|nr:peptide deformylase [Alphaproteobacteria bacterium]